MKHKILNNVDINQVNSSILSSVYKTQLKKALRNPTAILIFKPAQTRSYITASKSRRKQTRFLCTCWPGRIVTSEISSTNC